MSAGITLAEAFRRAFGLEAEGRGDQARQIYRSILSAVPDHPGALLRIAEMDLRQGGIAAARGQLVRALHSAERMGLPQEDVWIAIARLERAAGNPDEARRALGEALRRAPEHIGAAVESAVQATAAGDRAAATTRLEAAVARAPDAGSAWLHLALLLEQDGRLAEARSAAERAVGVEQPAPAAFALLARLATGAGELTAAEAACREGLGRFPGDPGLRHSHGILLKRAGRAEAACRELEAAVAVSPQDPGIRVSLGGACIDAGRMADARTHLERAIALGAAGGEVWDNLGIALRALGQDEAAVQAFERSVAVAPGLTPAWANLVQARQHVCAWDGLEAIRERLLATLDDPGSDPRWSPFIALAMDLEPAQHLVIARRWATSMLPRPVPPPPAHPRGQRLRVGYLSSDFREHPTGRLMAGLFESHDRTAVEVFGYSYGPDDGSPLRRRIEAAIEHWRDVGSLSDRDIAGCIREDRIDVLIDRKGLTRGSRLGILADRPAPVQLHYMSYPGTLGYDAIDGLIADAEVIPHGEEVHYHERIWRMPRCYFVNDSKRGVPPTDPRRDHGLPDDALVLACFNQAYKLTRPVFTIWMEALRAAPGAVLWLLAPGDAQRRNLRSEAGRAGVDADRRLVFAPGLPQEAHMRRVGCADLTLDTLPVGQHTTACDALWMGVPMLSCRGKSFVGRVGASLMRAVELPQLVTDDLAGYRRKLLELAHDPSPLAGYRQHLVTRRDDLPLFDTAGFARDWEALLVRAYEGTLAARNA